MRTETERGNGSLMKQRVRQLERKVAGATMVTGRTTVVWVQQRVAFEG